MNTPTHQLLLQPTDVLFFKDGRPMEGSASGHGAAWPLPHVLDAALHHALRRAQLADLHQHRLSRNGQTLADDREELGRTLGSLQTAGPFPVTITDDGTETWHFPRPLDLQGPGTEITHRPFLGQHALHAGSSNPLHPVINTLPPSKEKAKPWLSLPELEQSLHHGPSPEAGRSDADLLASENTIGIGINPETLATRKGAFYSASYLRLKPHTRLGLLTHRHDKKGGDLIEKAFANSGRETRVLVGGQQRSGTLIRTTPAILPLPFGHREGFPTALMPGPNGPEEKHLVRWILLTPAIYPEIPGKPAEGIPPHPGGSLPTWIDPETMELRLRTRPARQPGQSRQAWRKEVANAPFIAAKLVAALTGKPQPVTGWAATAIDGNTQETSASLAGARSTHLAVPAGSVYYFACDTAQAAQALADTLNWHGMAANVAASVPLAESVAAGVPPAATQPTDASETLASTLQPSQRLAATIVNRRSSLLGEKGYGLGICAPWSPHSPHQKSAK